MDLFFLNEDDDYYQYLQYALHNCSALLVFAPITGILPIIFATGLFFSITIEVREHRNVAVTIQQWISNTIVMYEPIISKGHELCPSMFTKPAAFTPTTSRTGSTIQGTSTANIGSMLAFSSGCSKTLCLHCTWLHNGGPKPSNASSSLCGHFIPTSGGR